MNTMNYDAMGAPLPIGGYAPYAPYAPPAPAQMGGMMPFFGPPSADQVGAFSADQVGAFPIGYGLGLGHTDIVGRHQTPIDASGRFPEHFEIVGQTPNANGGAATQDQGAWGWLQAPGPLDIKRLYWGLGATAIVLTWWGYYAKGWFGGKKKARTSGDFWL